MKHNRPILFALFAHPDDEAFGPGGTLALYSQTHDVYVICATRGEQGRNHSDNNEDHIGAIREQELHKSGDILGVKHVFFLDYQDGTLCNNIYREVAQKIIKIIEPYQPEILLTFEYRGVSGHIDHVFMSMVTHYIFDRVSYAKTLLSYCISDRARSEMGPYFIHVPPGYKKDSIDKVIDTSAVWEKKVAAMKAHLSQAKDAKRILERLEKSPKEEYFFMLEKNTQ